MLTWRRAVVCLGLGALTTLVVAWALAVCMVVNVPGGPWVTAEGLLEDVPDRARAWWCQVLERPGLTVVVWEPGDLRVRSTMRRFRSSEMLDGSFVVEPYFIGNGGRVQVVAAARVLDERRIPRWGRRDEPPPADTAPRFIAHSARGWPLRSVFYEVHLGAASRDNQGGIEVPPALEWLGPGPVLPGRVLVLGFAGNSLFYGATWLGLLAIPGMRRRRSRQRAGWCPGCGYDLRGSVHHRCPECGERIKSRVSATIP